MNDFKLYNYTDVADVQCGFQYWFAKLLAYCLNIFSWEGLPNNVNNKDIEQSLILNGYAVFTMIGDTPYVLNSQVYGVGDKWQPIYAIVQSPLFSKSNLRIGSDCEIIYNSDLQFEIYGNHIDGSLKTFIGRYARLLADVESTISIDLVNKRAPYLPVVDDDVTAKSVLTFFKNIIQGKRAVVSDSSILNELKTVQISDGKNDVKTIDLLLARDKILEQFYRDIGAKFYNPKKAQVNSEELNVNNQTLLISIDDMLEERKRGAERINKHYGINLSVKLNDKFDVNKVGGDNED